MYIDLADISVEETIEALTRKKLEAEALAEGLEKAIHMIKYRFVDKDLVAKGITPEDICYLNYSNTKEPVKITGVESTQWGVLKFFKFSARGKLHKTFDTEPWHYVSILNKGEAK